MFKEIVNPDQPLYFRTIVENARVVPYVRLEQRLQAVDIVFFDFEKAELSVEAVGLVLACAFHFDYRTDCFYIELFTEAFRVIGKKVCPEPNRNPCDKGRLHAGHSIAQQCPSAPPLHLFR